MPPAVSAPAETIPALVASGLAAGYSRSIVAIESASIRLGEMVCIVGPNGAGKSTLLRTLAGLQPPLAGEVKIAGQPLSSLSVHELARRRAVVLTENHAAGDILVREFVALGRHPHVGWSGRLGPDDRAAVDRAMAVVDVTALAGRALDRLSDGERQRAVLARALAQDPKLLILDEPTAFLDLERRRVTLETLRRIAVSQRRAVLLSTHDLRLACRLGDRLWVLAGDGKVVDVEPDAALLDGALDRAFRSSASGARGYDGGEGI